MIRKKVLEWSGGGNVDIILTSGGIGFGLTDLTPEALRVLLDK
jgi:molybdopterin biosynthesis enzyme MoaB